jgi:hypothetical protein
MLIKSLVTDSNSSQILSLCAVLGILLLFSQPVGATGKEYAKGYGGAKFAAGWTAPVDVDQLTEFVDAAYAQHGQAEFSKSVNIRAKIVSSVLSVADHHQRLSQRMGPGFEGFYLARRESNPGLEFVDLPYFHDEPYTMDSPLKEMVILQVTGEIDYVPLNYEAFLFHFVSPEGSCRVELADPVFPAVNDFAADALLANVFPDCEGPQATAERILMDTVPNAKVTGFDAATGSMLVSTVGDPSTVEEKQKEDPDGCNDFRLNKYWKWNASGVCRDLFFGGGKWVRGGAVTQLVSCIPEGDGCGVKTVASRDTLHSSIRPIDSWDCGCCVNFGATVSGGNDSANLISSNGTSGGHVAVWKRVQAFRTSTTSSMDALDLAGQCAGDLDLPHHGGTANVSGGGAFDFKKETKVQTNKSEIMGWNADSIAVHLCKPNKKLVKPKATQVKLMKQRVRVQSTNDYPWPRMLSTEKGR